MITEILLKSIFISLAIVGFRIVTSEGMILYFLRKPFEDYMDDLEYLKKKKMLDSLTKFEHSEFIKLETILYMAKPFITCVYCKASVYTLLINRIFFELDMWSIPQIFIVVTFNALTYHLYTFLKGE